MVREIEVQLRAPFRSGRGTVANRRVLLVTLLGEGLESWAECVAGVDDTSTETVDRAWSALTGVLLRGVVGKRFDDPAEIVPQDGATGDARAARAAVEMAVWDLAARCDGVSLSMKLGGTRDAVPVGVAVGLQDTDDGLLDVIADYLDEGYARIKLKITPGRDVEMLTSVRERFPRAVLWVDGNAAYTLSDASRLQRLDALDLGLIEQPLDASDLVGHAQLQEVVRTPICLDESIRSLADVDRALEIRACRAVNLKPGRVGGFAESLRIHGRLRASGTPLWCGGMLETGIGRAYNLALASLPGFDLPGDISATRRYWERDIVGSEFRVVDGRMRVPTGPGMGVDVDVERVEALTVRQALFGA